MKSLVLPGGFWAWLTKPLTGRDKSAKTEGRPASDEAVRPIPVGGPVVLLGGAPVPDEAVVAVLHMAGGRTANVVVVPVASESPGETGSEGARLFSRYGMKNVWVAPLSTREQADDPETAARLVAADIILLCGTDPKLGIERFRSTAAAAAVRRAHESGKILAGLDGGAVMLGEGLISGEEFLPGLGILPGLVVHTGFTQHARFGQMAKALQSRQTLSGAGVDHGVAMIIRGDEGRVLGDGGVTFLDTHEATSVPEETEAVYGIRVHVLTEGFGINLKTRKPLGPVKEPQQAVAER